MFSLLSYQISLISLMYVLITHSNIKRSKKQVNRTSFCEIVHIVMKYLDHF